MAGWWSDRSAPCLKESYAVARRAPERTDRLESPCRAQISMISHAGKLSTPTPDLEVSFCDDFSYLDTLDGSHAQRQGIRIMFSDAARIVYRLSGTGTTGAISRIYLERFERVASFHAIEVQAVFGTLASLARRIAKVEDTTRRILPSVITRRGQCRMAENGYGSTIFQL